MMIAYEATIAVVSCRAEMKIDEPRHLTVPRSIISKSGFLAADNVHRHSQRLQIG
jgi:hypothetical protein